MTAVAGKDGNHMFGKWTLALLALLSQCVCDPKLLDYSHHFLKLFGGKH